MKRLFLFSCVLFLACACSDSGATNASQDTQSGDSLCFCSSDADCDDGNPCTVDTCGDNCQCTYEAAAAGTDCQPANACLLAGTCQDGVCVSAGNLECSEADGNACTVPQCNPTPKPGEAACREVPVADGETIESYCATRVCESGQVVETTPTQAALACEQANDALDPKGCIAQRVCVDADKACVDVLEEDGSPCSQATNKCLGYACVEGECTPDADLDVVCEPPAECDDVACTQCTEFKCDPKDGACKAAKLDGPCDDGNVCTQDDSCGDASNPMYGQCKGTPKSCDDGKVCTVDSCDPVDGHCVNEPKNANCPGSNNPCVSQVFCDPFATPGADPNQDGCVVTYKPENTACNDGDKCTSNELCVAQADTLMCVGQPVNVDDGDPCTNDWCDPELGPQHEAIPNCNVTCDNGVCTPGQVVWEDCGMCGQRSHTCTDQCAWGPWGNCQNQGMCSPGETKSQPCGLNGQQTATCTAQCMWGPWGNCNEQCECQGGTCCSNGCDYDSYGTSCGDCKQCNGSGSCSANKPNGTWCPGGECYNGECVECVSGDEADCDPNCGVLSTPEYGLKECVNNHWDICKPVWCKDTNWPVVYQALPTDHDWHCKYNDNIGIYLCASVYLSWICVDYLEVDFMKSMDSSGNQDAGPWDNDIKVVIRHVDSGKTFAQAKVPCQGNTSTDGGCYISPDTFKFFDIGLSGTDSFEVDIYSPYTATEPVGTTGKFQISECW